MITQKGSQTAILILTFQSEAEKVLLNQCPFGTQETGNKWKFMTVSGTP